MALDLVIGLLEDRKKYHTTRLSRLHENVEEMEKDLKDTKEKIRGEHEALSQANQAIHALKQRENY